MWVKGKQRKPMVVLVKCLEVVSRRTQIEPAILCELRKQKWKFRETKPHKIYRARHIMEEAAQREPERGSLGV